MGTDLAFNIVERLGKVWVYESMSKKGLIARMSI